MRALRTPDERFAGLPGFPFAPHYAEVDDLDGGSVRVHWVDEGSTDAPVVLLLHGEPSWSYLYRTMIPILVAAGLRAVAPDMVGFGRSDKPAARDDHSYERHVAWLAATIDAIGIDGITLVCQDWGGLLGLRVLAEQPDRFARVVAANTFLPTGDGSPSEGFLSWLRFSQEVPELPVGRVLRGGCITAMPEEVMAAYDAPFPDESYKAGARQLPVLVPITADDPAAAANRDAWDVLARWDRPFVTAFSDQDAVTRGGDLLFQTRVPGAAGQPHVTLSGGGHFLQEDVGDALARVVVDVVERTS